MFQTWSQRWTEAMASVERAAFMALGWRLTRQAGRGAVVDITLSHLQLCTEGRSGLPAHPGRWKHSRSVTMVKELK